MCLVTGSQVRVDPRARDDGLVLLLQLWVEPERSTGLRFLLWVFHVAGNFLAGTTAVSVRASGQGCWKHSHYCSPDNAGVLLCGLVLAKKEKNRLFQHILSDQRIVLTCSL